MKEKDNKSDIKIEIRPHNLEAEQNLIGLLLSNNENMNKIGDVLKEEHFYLPLHGKIYNGISKLMDKGLVSDPITIKNYFINEEIFKDAGTNSYEYLLKIVEEAQLNTDIKTLAKNIYDTYLRREIINLSEEYIIKAKEEKIDEKGEQLIESLEHELYTLASSSDHDNKLYTITDSVKEVITKIEKTLKSRSDTSGVDTGYTELNRLTSGFQRSDLIIVAGRPSMGKTALAVNIALSAAKSFVKAHESGEDKVRKSVCLFSLEMSAEQLASRVLSMETKINASKIRVGKVSQEEFKKLSQQIAVLSNVPIMIDDTPALTISAIRTKARRMKRQNNLGMLVIDYLQLIRGSSRHKENRVQEIGEISQGLKAIAKELDVPVITASQLSRAVESREDKRPLLSDLRESGNIEQDADIVMFIYREEYYLDNKKSHDSKKLGNSHGENETQLQKENKKAYELQEKMDQVKNIAEIIIAKQRNGPVGSFELRYDKETTTFENLA
jgi:replicative DNA helicase